jgi:ribose-phosphate pyrophosphokinase
MKDSVVLFKLTSSPKLAQEVADLLHLPLGKSEVNHFADGEFLARATESVRGKTCYVIQSTCNPGSERLLETLIFVDALRNAKAKEINLVVPYFGFSRQDRIARAGEPITARLVADMIDTVGVNRVITVDLHTQQIQGFFSCPVDDISVVPLFGDYYRKKLASLKIKTEDVVVVSPDHGSIHRARDLATELPNSGLAIIDKRRPAPNVAEVVSVVGDVSNKTCIILDDIIDTGGTALGCAEALRARGAKQVMLAGTHAIFSGNCVKKLESAHLSDIVVTNSIEQNSEGVNVISLAPMIAEVIKATEEGRSVPDSRMP